MAAGLAPVFIVGGVIIGQETLKWEPPRPLPGELRAEYGLPEWFPDWLLEQLTPEEARKYITWIYWGGLEREDVEKIPSLVYHATPNPEEIMRVGFKTEAELGVRGFGGAGNYVSVTTLDNARIYLENMRMGCKIINGLTNLRELKEWMRKASRRESDQPFEKSFESAKASYMISIGDSPEIERMGIDYPPFNTPEFMWQVFEKGDIMDGPGFVLFMGKPTLLHKNCEEIKIIEAKTSPRLKFRHPYNIFRDTPMSGYYTYNRYEKQWRIWDTSDIKPLRVIATSQTTSSLPSQSAEVRELRFKSIEEMLEKGYVP